MSDAEPLLAEVNDSIFILTLNRPDKLNAMSRRMLEMFGEAIVKFRDNDDLHVMLIRSTGRYFCAGADVIDNSMPDFGDSTSKVRTWYRTKMSGTQRTWEEFEACEKPIVVAHHAMCVGGGLEMSLACDFRLAAENAGYSFPEAKFGSLPASNGVSRLPRVVGPHWARWLILANRKINAQEALNMGLVHKVYPNEGFEESVMEFCRELAAQPREMTALAKLSIELSADLELGQARNVERLAQSILATGSEHNILLEKMREYLRNPKNRKDK
jgi:enoyl-CoA hydratase